MSEAVISTAPGTSAPSRNPMPLSVSISRPAITAVAMPTGTLTKKIQCQLIDWVNTPPTSKPTAPPADATKAKTPIALACSRGSGNMVTIMPSITAEVMAPPAPWTKRAATSSTWLWARPHRSEATVNTARPARNMPLREARSPNRPASNSRPPKEIRYAFTTHANPDCVKPRSLCMEGNATFTTVASSTIMSIPIQSTCSEIQRLLSVKVPPSAFLLGNLRRFWCDLDSPSEDHLAPSYPLLHPPGPLYH